MEAAVEDSQHCLLDVKKPPKLLHHQELLNQKGKQHIYTHKKEKEKWN